MKITKDNIYSVLIRAIRTMAQVMLGYITVGAALTDINWKAALSVTLVSGLYSILTAIATGLPEASNDGTLRIDTSGEKDIYRFEVDSIDKLTSKKKIILAVDTDTELEKTEDDIN